MLRFIDFTPSKTLATADVLNRYSFNIQRNDVRMWLINIAQSAQEYMPLPTEAELAAAPYIHGWNTHHSSALTCGRALLQCQVFGVDVCCWC